jgi:hypothetical protein
MTDAEMIAAIESKPGPTLLTFVSRGDANVWLLYVAAKRAAGLLSATGVMVEVRDTRTGSGLICMWRDPVPSADVDRCQREALWQLEMTLAGHFPVPPPGQIADHSAQLKQYVRDRKMPGDLP